LTVSGWKLDQNLIVGVGSQGKARVIIKLHPFIGISVTDDLNAQQSLFVINSAIRVVVAMGFVLTGWADLHCGTLQRLRMLTTISRTRRVHCSRCEQFSEYYLSEHVIFAFFTRCCAYPARLVSMGY
jgi:hypothetical protein